MGKPKTDINSKGITVERKEVKFAPWGVSVQCIQIRLTVYCFNVNIRSLRVFTVFDKLVS